MILSNALIGLREGLEAGIIISILVAFLVRGGRRAALPLVWGGIAAAVVVSVAAGGVLTFTAARLTDRGTELFEAGTSLVAVALVTGMVFWMRHPVRALEEQLRGQISEALRIGPIAVITVTFLAVVREGLEAAIFVFVGAQGTGTTRPLLSFLAGVAVAIVLAWLLYQGTLRISLSRFFTITGVLLIFVAAGIFGHGVHDLQQAAVLPGLTAHAFDVNSVIPVESWYGSLLHGIFNFSPRPTVLELLAWAGYVAAVLTTFLLSLRGHAPSRPVAERTAQQAEALDGAQRLRG